MNNYITDILPDTSGKNIIITGANGYIGRELINQLDINKIDYIGIDKQANDDLPHMTLNLADSKSISYLSSSDCDYLIHAGTHSALAYQNNFLESFYEDLRSLRNIFIGLGKKPKVRLIYFSSSYVYSGISREKIVNETTALKPLHNFGLAKSFFEEMIERTFTNYVIFRLSSVFGGSHSLHPNAITNMVQEATQNGFLTVWGNGDRQMQYTYIEDVVKYIIQSFVLDPGVYNLGSDDYQTVLQTAHDIAEYFGVGIKKLSDKPEGMTLPFMENNKLISASNINFSVNQSSHMKNYLDQLNASL